VQNHVQATDELDASVAVRFRLLCETTETKRRRKRHRDDARQWHADRVSFQSSRATAMTSRSSDLSRRSGRQQTGSLARIARAVRAFFAALTSSYHPERHYMRGGGTGGVA
jgi:hypothetical protein